MRIVLVNSVCGIGSTGRICADLTQSLINRGNDAMIAYGRGKSSNGLTKNSIRIGNDKSVAVHGFMSRLFDMSGLGSIRATKDFVNWIESYKPDIIHLHNVHGYYIHVPTLFQYLKSSRIKVIWTLHDTWAFSGHSGTCDKVECTKWKKGCSLCPLRREYPSTLFDFSKRNWTWKKNVLSGLPNLTIVTPSRWLEEAVKESFLQKYKTVVIHNGIDTRVFKPLYNRPINREEKKGKIKILGVANAWSKYKGLDDFYKLSQILDSDKYQITLVGLTGDQRSKLPPHILGIEKTRNVEELVRLYNDCDYFVNMTYCDVFPTVNLEALSCGAKVITYSTGGCPETVRDFGGIVVPRGDLNSIVQAIEAIPDGIVNVDKVHKNYSIDRFTNDYLALYDEALKK